MMAWVTQGPISDRTTERLGTTDQGVILYRSVLLQQIEKAERGEDPLGVLRDPAKNVCIPVRLEGPQHAAVGGFLPGVERVPFAILNEPETIMRMSAPL
jgi:5,5'-dehydrodivanillate O-demethylase oxygenase subunit